MQCDSNWNESDDLSEVNAISLERFYSSVAHITFSDKEALEFMAYAAKISMFKFNSSDEMLSFKADFQAALAFI